MSHPDQADVVVGADGSPAADNAVRWAAREAVRRQATLHIVYAIGVPTDVGPTFDYAPIDSETCRRAGRRTTGAAEDLALEAAASWGRLEVTSSVVDTAPIPLLRDTSDGAQLLVVGTRGHGALRRGLLGSVSTSLARHAHCPVAVIPTHHPDIETGPVVVGIDGSPASLHALELACQAAVLRTTGLVAVHTWSETGHYRSREELQDQAEELVHTSLAEYREKYPELPIETVVQEQRPVRALLEASSDAQLIVMGSRGRGSLAGMTLGSVSHEVLHAADRPVVITRRTAGHPQEALTPDQN